MLQTRDGEKGSPQRASGCAFVAAGYRPSPARRIIMKEKHIRIRIEQCLALAEASNCPRRKFGALLLDPERNVVLMDGYNGGPRGGGNLCGGEVCLRDTKKVVSGTRREIGCHHPEVNVGCYAGGDGVRCRG